MADPSPRSAMQEAEMLIRAAAAGPTPADRAGSLMEAYRLAEIPVKSALVMGLIARVACAESAS